MTFRKSWLTWIVLLLSVMLSGCISRWTEDVELGDGTIIKVTRTEKYGGGGGIGESCQFCTFEWARISFEYNGNQYHWKSLPKSQVPMILDVVDGVPVVISHPKNSRCPKLKPNSHEYSFYMYSIADGGAWRVSFDSPGNIKTLRNLHWYKPRYASGLSVQEKAKWVDKYKSGSGVYRRPEIVVIEGADGYCGLWR